MRGRWALLVALVVATPIVGANPDQCQTVRHSRVFTGPNVTVDQGTHSCSGTTGTQTWDRYDVNMTYPNGEKHNVTYQSETDTGSWEPSWCRYPPGSARCSSFSVTYDGQTNLTGRYRESADGSWCQYTFLVITPSLLFAPTVPRNDQCMDYVTMLP